MPISRGSSQSRDQIYISYVSSIVKQVLDHLSHLGSPCCCCSVAQSCPTLCEPMERFTRGFPVLHYHPDFAQTLMSTELVMPYDHLILCHPLLLLPSIFPSIRVFSNESALCIRWPNYWSFSFSISPSNEYSGLISSRVDWFDLHAHKGLSKVFSSTTIQKHQFFSPQPSLWSNYHIRT